jgi:phospholipid/cholesterol/gamma-HCH transport system ATP-binding protein
MNLKNESISKIILSVELLTKSFGENHILKNISLYLRENENLVVMGRSGAGKSLLIKCIVGLIKPDRGSIFFNNIDLAKSSSKEIFYARNSLGFLFQSGALYDSMSVRENLEFPLRRRMLKLSTHQINLLVDEALNDVGLLNTKNLMPQELSGGMRKRIGLARTLILKPKIIFYDEPTTGLDTATSREIINLINVVKIKYLTSAIIISHDIECIKLNSDRVVLLHDGQIYANENYISLLNSNDINIRQFFPK